MSATAKATTIRVRGLRFTKSAPFKTRKPARSQCKPVQERKPVRNHGKTSQHQQDSEGNQQTARGHFDRMHMRAEPAIKFKKALHTQCRQQERHCQAQRINREQNHAFRQSILRGSQGKDASKNRADEWSPAEGEREADPKS